MIRHTAPTITATRTTESPAIDTISDDSVTPIPVMLIIETNTCAPASNTPMITMPLPASSSPLTIRPSISRGDNRPACVTTKASNNPITP